MLSTNFGTLLRHMDSEKIILGPKLHITYQYDEMDEITCYQCGVLIRCEERRCTGGFEDDFTVRVDQTLCSDCDWQYNYEDYDFEEVQTERMDYHPSNQLPGLMGLCRAAYIKASTYNYPGGHGGHAGYIRTPSRNRADESRTHSRTKKPWRRYQQARENEKIFVDSVRDLGIPPKDAREQLRREQLAEKEFSDWDFVDYVYDDYEQGCIEEEMYFGVILRDKMLYGHLLHTPE